MSKKSIGANFRVIKLKGAELGALKVENKILTTPYIFVYIGGVHDRKYDISYIFLIVMNRAII